MKKATVLMTMFMTAAAITACGSTKENPAQNAESTMASVEAEESQYSQESAYDEENQETEGNVSDDQKDESAPDMVGLQQLYSKADEYEYMALGYYQDFKDPTMIRDGYVPYDENYVQESTEYLKSEAHGISIRLFMVEGKDATVANEKLIDIYKEQLEARGISAQFGEIQTYDNNTIAICQVMYENEEGEAVTTILYSDIRDDGTVYMCAEIEFNKGKYDDVTPDLLEEVGDAYGMDLSAVINMD